jgi:tripartite-type tricarboxylate transporter receptor subunit TctC
MKTVRYAVACVSLSALLTLGFLPPTLAQQYPAKSIRLIIPFAPGGPNDISARIIADELSRSLQQSVIVDNRPGAGGNIGAEAAAKSAPDGYTLFWAQAATHGINPSLYRKLGYDAIKDFVPVALLVSEPLVLVTGAASPWTNTEELIAAAKAAPGKLHFGSGGIGTTPHLAGELFGVMAGASFTHVPYRGNAPAVTDTIAGRVQFVFDGINASIGHVRAGTLKALAVTSRERASALPDVPTVAEMLPGFEAISWGGIVAPAGTPADVVARLSREMIEVGKRPDAQRRFSELGAHLRVSTPTEMDQVVRAQIDRWRGVIEKTGIQVD